MPAPSLAAQADFYDARWAKHEFADRMKLRRAVAILDALSRTGLKQPRIFEMGCGTGWLTNILNQFGPTTGVDLSPAAIETARAHYPTARFEVCDDIGTGLVGQYDVLVSHEVIEHLADQPAHVALMARLLRPGGTLILTTPNGAARGKWWGYADEGGGQVIEHHLTARELRDILTPHFAVQNVSSLLVHRRMRPFAKMGHFGKHLIAVAQRLD